MKHNIIDKPFWVYTVEMYRTIDGVGQWVSEFRLYKKEKQLDSFDLKPIEGKRRNAKFIKHVK